ncbi:MAG: nitrate- and nitrite sensing domain-containing protein [Actinomycetota bacterium]
MNKDVMPGTGSFTEAMASHRHQQGPADNGQPVSSSIPDSTPRNADIPRRPISTRRRRWWRDSKIRTRIILILVVPLFAVALINGLHIANQVGTASAARDTAQLARLQIEASSLVDALQVERTGAVVYLETNPEKYEAQPGGPSAESPVQNDFTRGSGERFRSSAEATDEQIETYKQEAAKIRDDVSVSLGSRFDAISGEIDRLAEVRKDVNAGDLSTSAITLQYTTLVSDLISLGQESNLTTDDRQLSRQVSAAAAYARYKEYFAQEQALLADLFTQRTKTSEQTVSPQQTVDVIGVITAQEAEYNQFVGSATLAQRELASRVVSGERFITLLNLEQQFLSSSRSGLINGSQSDWIKASEARLNSMSSVQRSVIDSVVSNADALGTDALNELTRDVLVGLIAGLLALIIGLLIARSMVRPLQQLRTDALDVAYRRLPAAVQAMQHGDSPQDLELVPVRGAGRDEIGQVAGAFTVVQQEAVRIAGEQAAMRQSVSAMFGNLARRSQTLVGRVINQIDVLERDESDPDRLQQIFHLDHLVTRMRRNDDNLLVLAGSDTASSWTEPASVRDVLRAAAAEVEQYQRIEMGIIEDASLVAGAVKDVVHLLAELMENATGYSSPRTSVIVDSRRVGERVIVEIEDRGVGLSAQSLQEANERLRSTPTLDVVASRRMGLYVVGRLAARHEIVVRLRAADGGGILAMVEFPSSIIARTDSKSRSGAGDQRELQQPPALPGSRAPQRAIALADSPSQRSDIPMKRPALGRTVSEPTSPPIVRPISAPVPPMTPGEIVVEEKAPEPSPTAQVENNQAALYQRDTSAQLPQATSTKLSDEAVPEEVVAKSTGDEAEGLPIFDSVHSEWFQLPDQAEAVAVEANPSWQTTADLGWEAASQAARHVDSWQNVPASQVPVPDSRPENNGARNDVAVASAENPDSPSTLPISLTPDGLPRRVPMAQLVPGSVRRVEPAVSTNENGRHRTSATQTSSPSNDQPSQFTSNGSVTAHHEPTLSVRHSAPELHRRSPEKLRGTLTSYYQASSQGRADGRARRAAVNEASNPGQHRESPEEEPHFPPAVVDVRDRQVKGPESGQAPSAGINSQEPTPPPFVAGHNHTTEDEK